MNTSDKNRISSLFKKLSSMHCITSVWEKVLEMLAQLQPDISFEALAVICIYFSQIDDGNTCIPLDTKVLTEKWLKKWEGLLMQENLSKYQNRDSLYFSDIINKGLPQISTSLLPNLIAEADFSKPFVIDDGWLFATKYYKAKLSIEKRISLIMEHNYVDLTSEKKERIREYFKKLTESETGSPMLLKDEQTEAILRGLSENLIITGGPGTGKTTVICYLLWELFMSGNFMDYSLYLAAPSGKAADRMKESISETLSKLNIEKLPEAELARARIVFEKLNSTGSSTLHRLLSFSSSTNGFRYNAEKQFDAKAIFVIDEASMIDITLFSSLLEAIPEGARVFILGDKDQLPSVQAGAVLGELLARKTESVAELRQSSRFNDNSEIGLLKNALQEDKVLDKNLAHFTDWNNWKTHSIFTLPPKGSFPVTTFIPPEKYSEQTQQLNQMISTWSSAFYSSLVQKAKEAASDFAADKLDELWEAACKARILCAERKGIRGVETINSQICSAILQSDYSIYDSDYFEGQLLMLTKNQSIFCLYNGDSGIVIEHNDLKYLMVKKELKSKAVQSETSVTNERSLSQHGIFQKNSYLFYPLHLLPRESLEVAYAITIHKSQGSGYPAILVFLPEQAGHPLLNRQIAYTAITRTKGSTYIFADYETLENARKTVIQRDTLISLN